MCGEEFANKYLEFLHININVITKQKVAETLSVFCFVLISHIDLFLFFIVFCYILSPGVT